MAGKHRANGPFASDRESMTEAWQMLLGIGQATSLTTDAKVLKEQSVSFTLITGFLGTGKTTLVNKLLSEPHDMRIAVIVNDFGSVNIDAALIRTRSVDSIDLTNGCVCCTLANGLVRTLAELVAREEPPEHVILEASGIAEPYGVVQVALCNRSLRLNGIVCLVDADKVAEQLDNAFIEPVIRRQTAAADLVVINKVDLANDGQVRATRRWLMQEQPRTRVVATSFGDVPAMVLLGSSPRSAFIADEAGTDHSNAFETFTFATDELFDDRLICSLMDSLPEGVLRIKGILRLASSPSVMSVLQATAGRWSLEKEAELSSCLRSEIVVIGLRGEFDASNIQTRLRECEAQHRGGGTS